MLRLVSTSRGRPINIRKYNIAVVAWHAWAGLRSLAIMELAYRGMAWHGMVIGSEVWYIKMVGFAASCLSLQFHTHCKSRPSLDLSPDTGDQCSQLAAAT